MKKTRIFYSSVLLLLFLSMAGNGQDFKSKVDSINAIPYQFIVSNIYKSIDIFTQNAIDAERIGYKLGAAKSYSQLGKALYLNGKYDASTLNYLKSINLFEELNDNNGLAGTYGEYGYQLKRRDMPKANLYMRKGIHLAETNKSDTLLASLYDNYGVLKEMENKLDSAVYFYSKSLSLKNKMKDKIGIPYSLNKLAGIEAMRSKFSAALNFLKQSDAFRNNEEGDFGKVENLAMYGDVYKQMNLIDSAITNFNKCLSLSQKNGINYLVRYCYEQLTSLYKAKEDFQKAYKSLEMLSLYKDSVLNKEVSLNIAQLELSYESEKKDHEIAVSKLELSKKTSLLYLLAAIAIVLGTISFTIYKNQKKKREKERRELEFSNKLKNAELEKKMADEKLHISRELHDNIGSHLTFMISSIDNIAYSEKENTKANKLNGLSLFGRETLNELRNTIWALKHEDSELKELILKIKELISRINNNIDAVSISLVSDVDETIRLSATQMLNIFRIFQEATQNILKHSGATAVIVEFKNNLSGFDFIIKDNGKGFDTTKKTKNNGLINMNQRCEESGGTLQIHSSVEGTEIICSFILRHLPN